MSRIELSLHEQLVLLAIDTTYGPIDLRITAKFLDIGVAGAILLLLLRRGRVTFQRDSFSVRGQLSVGDSEVDELLKGLENKADPFKPMRINKWLQRAARAQLQNAVISGLVVKGIIARKKRRFSILKPEVREEIVRRLRGAIREQERADEKTAALASLAHASMCLHKREFGDEMKRYKTQLNALGKQTGPVIPAVHTAVSNKKFQSSLQQVLFWLIGTLVALLMRYFLS